MTVATATPARVNLGRAVSDGFRLLARRPVSMLVGPRLRLGPRAGQRLDDPASEGRGDSLRGFVRLARVLDPDRADRSRRDRIRGRRASAARRDAPARRVGGRRSHSVWNPGQPLRSEASGARRGRLGSHLGHYHRRRASGHPGDRLGFDVVRRLARRHAGTAGRVGDPAQERRSHQRPQAANLRSGVALRAGEPRPALRRPSRGWGEPDRDDRPAPVPGLRRRTSHAGALLRRPLGHRGYALHRATTAKDGVAAGRLAATFD